MKLTYLVAAATFTAAALQAQTTEQSTPGTSPGWHEHGFNHHHAMIWRKLNLTDEQKTQLKAVKENFRKQPAFRSALANYLTAKSQLMDAVNAGDAAKIRDASTDLATAETDFATQRAQELVQVKAILRPDQLTTWNQIQQKRATRLQEKIQQLKQAGS